MAFNAFGTDTGLEDFSGGQTSEEERKRRLALMSSLAGGGSFTDNMANFATNRLQNASDRIQQAGQTLANPQQAIQNRISGAVAPTPMQQPIPVQAMSQAPDESMAETNRLQAQNAVAAPVQPNQPPPELPSLPQPSEGVQVAGPTQLPPAPAPTPSWTEQVGNIASDEGKLAQYIGNPDNPKEGINFAKQRLQELWKQTNETKTAEAKVNAAVQSGDLLPLMKEIKKQTTEGSYIKAYLFNRLGLTELAKEEQQKLGAGMTYASAVGPTGERALINYDANGMPIKGFDSSGKQLSPEKLAEYASGAIGPQTKSFMLPSAHGTPVQRTNAQGQVETGLMMYDPALRQTYVQVGNTKLPTTGWTTMAQTPQSVYGAAGAQKQGGMAAETGVQQPQLPPMAGTPQLTQAVPAPAAPVAAPTAAPAASAASAAPATQIKPQVQATPSPTGGVKLSVGAPAKTAGGGAVVVQQPGESYASFQQRKKAQEEQTQASIQLNKEVSAAEQKVPAEARGQVQAKDIVNQNFADQTYDLIKPVASLIKESTGSGIGTKVDVLASQFGVGTKGAQAIAQLEPMVYPILMNVPRFEGPQSDRDVEVYMRAAGDFANPEKPIATRLAALQGIITLLKKYDKAGKNDWTFSGGNQTQPGQIKIIKREKVQ